MASSIDVADTPTNSMILYVLSGIIILLRACEALVRAPWLPVDPGAHFLVRQVTEAHVEGHLILPDFALYNRTAHLFDFEPVERFERLVRPGDSVGDSLRDRAVRNADDLGDDVSLVLHTHPSFRI